MSTTTVRPSAVGTVTAFRAGDLLLLPNATSGLRVITKENFNTELAALSRATPADGLATLNSSGKHDVAQVNYTTLDFQGSSTVAALPDPSTLTSGQFYLVTDTGTNWTKTWSQAGEMAVSDGTTYHVGPVGIQTVAQGGTGSSNAAGAQANLNLFSREEIDHRQLSKAVGNAAWFDGAASVLSNADTGDLANYGDGSKDYPLYAEALIWVDDVSAGFPICGRYDSGKREWFFSVNSSGFLLFRTRDDDQNVVATATATTLGLEAGRWYLVEAYYDGRGGETAAAGVTLRVNGNDCSVSAPSVSGYVAMEDKGGSFRVGEDNNGGTHAKGYISSVILGTFDPGTGNVDSRVLVEDQWAALAYDHDADFSSDSTDSYSASGGAVDATTTVGAEADNIQFTIDSSTGVHQLARSISITVGKRYDWEVEVYIPSGNTDIDGVVLKDDASGISENFEGVTQDSWERLDTSGIAAGTTIQIRALKGSSVSFTGNGTDTFAVRLSRVRKGGIRASYQARNIQSNGDIIDESSNQLDLSATSVTRLFDPQPYLPSGTYTPGLTFGGGNTGLTTSKDEGYYEYLSRNLIYVEIRIQLTAKGSSTGTANIGLPVTSTSDANRRAVLNVIIQNGTGVDDGIAARAGGGTSTLILSDMQTGVGATISAANFTDTTNLYISGVYRID